MATGTGTRATSGRVTAAALVAQARAALGDGEAATWSDEELLGYVNEAIGEYSVHLPRESEAVMALYAGLQTYVLPRETIAVLSARYVAPGEERLLRRRSYRNPSFTPWARVYDFVDASDGAGMAAVWLSFDPVPGATLTLRVGRPHDHDLPATGYVTVPPAHHHVLVAYVLFAAARRLQQQEQAAPTSNSSLLMAQLASNTRRLELAYLNALNRILTHEQGRSEVVVWG